MLWAPNGGPIARRKTRRALGAPLYGGPPPMETFLYGDKLLYHVAPQLEASGDSLRPRKKILIAAAAAAAAEGAAGWESLDSSSGRGLTAAAAAAAAAAASAAGWVSPPAAGP
ncbi:hypothetical protein Emag_007599 [Eimeria magna]